MECMISRPSEGAAGKTGLWRTFKPVVNYGRCNRCMMCWLYCPENAIDNEVRINYDYCKGCGICAKICARGAIEMVREGDR